MKRLRASGYVACMQIKHLQALIDKWAQHTVVVFFFQDRLHYDVVEESQGSLMLNCSVRCAVMLVVSFGVSFFFYGWQGGVYLFCYLYAHNYQFVDLILIPIGVYASWFVVLRLTQKHMKLTLARSYSIPGRLYILTNHRNPEITK